MSLSNFNSIKVQLELSLRRVKAAVCTFQFHKGTIRTHLQSYDKQEDGNFNSIKVQLEPLHDVSRELVR